MSTPEPTLPDIHLLPITEVERLTGIRQGTLRMWERRYGFPQPLRDRHGDRVYPMEQVERLQAARRLMLQGVRPGRIFAAGAAPAIVLPAQDQPSAQHQLLIGLLRSYRLADLHAQFQFRLMNLGLRGLVLGCLAPLSASVIHAARRGELPPRCVHLHAQLVASVLHAGMAAVRTVGDGRPKAVLATLAGDSHALGSMMAEAILTTLEVDCIQLGADMPPLEIAAAAVESGASLVVISFHTAAPRRNLGRIMSVLRTALPAGIALWMGGSAARQAAPPPGVELVAALADIEPTLARWRAGQTPCAGPA